MLISLILMKYKSEINTQDLMNVVLSDNQQELVKMIANQLCFDKVNQNGMQLIAMNYSTNNNDAQLFPVNIYRLVILVNKSITKNLQSMNYLFSTGL